MPWGESGEGTGRVNLEGLTRLRYLNLAQGVGRGDDCG